MVQRTVNLYPAIGFAGQQVAFNQAVYTPENFISDGTVVAGGFAFASTAAYTGTAAPQNVASATGERLLGFVERVISAEIELAEPGKYLAGEELTIAIKGDYYMVAPSAATIGQKVLVNGSTGAVSLGNSAASGTVDTGWTVAKAGDEGDMIIISNH